jgi:hypothetical protein
MLIRYGNKKGMHSPSVTLDPGHNSYFYYRRRVHSMATPHFSMNPK